jgi:Arc/MetJ-type ribon-helix-helix transcriptional regulator
VHDTDRRPWSPEETAGLTDLSHQTNARSVDLFGSRRIASGMVLGMATRKVTVTLNEAQLDQIRTLVDAGNASSVSGFVQHAVSVAIDDVAGWGALLAEALRETGGPLTDEERAWADELLGTRRRRRGSAA